VRPVFDSSIMTLLDPMTGHDSNTIQLIFAAIFSHVVAKI